MFQVVPINMVQDVIMYDMSTRHIRYRELQFGCVPLYQSRDECEAMRHFLWSRFVLKTAALTIGAAIVFVNSPWYTPRQRPYDFSQLQSAVLKKLDHSGQLIKATELWREHGAVINVVRRVG